MKHIQKKNYFFSLFVVYLAALNPAYSTLVVNDTLTGASSSYDWQALNGACLTAGNNTGSIPACRGLPYYAGKTLVGGVSGRLPDPVGKGALRLTNGDWQTGNNGNYQTGAVYSKFSFPSNSGVNITFKTVTYGGNAYPNHAGVRSGADGITFFLTDAAQIPVVNSSTELGADGGALGYACGNTLAKPNGLYGAYIGLGIDEFGNFSNSIGASNSGVTNTGGAQDWNRISLRGAGNTNWRWLSTKKSQFYPPSVLNTPALQVAAVQKTCATGKLWKYTKSGANVVSTEVPRDAAGANYAGFYNYPMLAWARMLDTQKKLPNGTLDPADTDDKRKLRRPIFNQQAVNLPKRDLAIPITYNVQITQDGLLSFSYSYNGGATVPVMNKKSIIQSNGPLPANYRFGFSSGTGSGSNVHEIICFKAEPIVAASSSAGGNIPQQGRVQAGSQVYIASYHLQNWWGQLTAQSLIRNPDDSVTLKTNAEWDASCKLTGGACASTGVSTAAQTSRKLFTWNGSTGIALNYDNLTNVQQIALGKNINEPKSRQALDYIKGNRSAEISTSGTGTFRARNSVLGDIINSSPTWVGAPASPYEGPWVDMLHGGAMPEASSYTTFKNNNITRTNVVYVGANDGFLHGFRAGKSTAAGVFNPTTNDGTELIGYMPDQALRTINNTGNNSLAFPSVNYGHNAFVDATPGTGDIFYNGAWHTWLVGGLGGGGNNAGVVADDTGIAKGAIYALDITNPDNFSASSVIGEWNSDNLTCVNDTLCKDSLGSTVGVPLIRRLHDGNWAVIFPNGQNSKSGKAGIYIMTVKQNGSKSFRFIEAALPQTSGGVITKRNGISQVTAVDLDGDHVTDYLYAGDMLGNLWRFDLTSNDPATWVNSNSKSLVFNAGQPITTSIIATSTVEDDEWRVVLNFGTGRIYPQTLSQPSRFNSGAYYLYGIWDGDMADWNSKSTFTYSATTPAVVPSTALQVQTITDVNYSNATLGIEKIRTISQNKICWKDSTACASGNDKRGWKMKLTGTDEQVIYNPVFQDGFFIINTTIPEVAQPLSCDVKPAAGYTMALLPSSGTTAKKSYFKDVPGSMGVAGGIGTGGVGSLMVVKTEGRAYGISQTASGTPKVFELDPSLNITAKRTTWIQRR